jgi:Mce-associated membrane protein
VSTTPAANPEPEPAASPETEPADGREPTAAAGPEPETGAGSEPPGQAEPETDIAAEPETEAVGEPEPPGQAASEPEHEADIAAQPETEAAAEHGSGGPRQRRALVLIGAAAAVLAAFAVWAGLQAHSLRDQTAAQNLALTDRPATLALTRQITSAIDTVFSYDYADTAKTSTAAQALLTGQAIRQYDSLFALVRRDAPTQHLVLTTTVTNAGVELLTGNRARVLVFANQRDTRGTTHQTSYAGAMFAVNAVRQAGRWRIDTIDTFTGS